MYPENYYQENEAEISDELFDEIFEEESEGVFPDYESSDYESSDYENSDYENSDYDSIYDEDNIEQSVDTFIENLSQEIEGLNPQEAQDHISEAWPALIPLIAALAPSVIQAATSLAPVAVKAVGGLMGGGSKRQTPRRPPRRSPQRPNPQLYKPVPKTCSCQHPTGGALAGIGKGALGTLANLLGNKNVQGIISNLANKGISQALKLGNSEALAREGALLEAIEYLARTAQTESMDDQYDDAMDYLKGADGNFEVDANSHESRAERFIELFEN